MKKIIFLLFLNIAVMSCNQRQNKNGHTAFSEDSPAPLSKEKENFREGIIDVDIHFPGNELSTLLKKIDPTKGSIEQQLKTLAGTLSSEDQQKIEKATSGNPFVAMQIMLAPLKSRIYVKENIATAKCDGLSYHIENTVNTHSNTGTVYVSSRANPSNTVTITYDEDFFGESQFQVKIDEESYTRQKTNETRIVAGYTCKKSIYTLKTDSSMGVAKLEVWTSEQMPKSLNFIHPYYLEEEHGIMKIDLFANTIDGPTMVYEFKTISPTAVSDSDLSIVQKNPVYNAKTDLGQIAGKLMGIMFGT